MNKKIYIIITVIAVIIIAGAIFIGLNKQGITNQPAEKTLLEKSTSNAPVTSTASTPEKQAEKTGNFENSQLLEIAKKYVLKKPQLYWNKNKFVAWDNYKELGSDFSKASPEWIISQKSNIRYIELNKYPAPYDDWNDKYIVSWFFIPGCEENPNRSDSPNWFDKTGHNCLGGYNLDVVINSDGTVNRAELNALN